MPLLRVNLGRYDRIPQRFLSYVVEFRCLGHVVCCVVVELPGYLLVVRGFCQSRSHRRLLGLGTCAHLVLNP